MVFFRRVFAGDLALCRAAVFAFGRVLPLVASVDLVFALTGIFRFLAGFAARFGEDFLDAGCLDWARVFVFLVFFMLALRVFFPAMIVHLPHTAIVRKGVRKLMKRLTSGKRA
jgi:hypothetical protein